MIKFLVTIMILNISLFGFGGIVQEAVSVRAKPSTNSMKIAVKFRGEKVQISQTVVDINKNKWYKLTNGYYMFAKYIDTSFNIIKTIPLENKIVKIQSAINIRETPSLLSKKLGLKYQGETVKIIAKVITQNKATWYKLEDGYIYAKLIDNIIDKKVVKLPQVNKYYVDANTLDAISKALIIDGDSIYTKFFIPNKTIIVIEENNNTLEEDEVAIKVINHKYFLGAAIGLTKISATYNATRGVFTTVNSSDDQGMSILLELGMKLDNKRFTTLSFHYINLDDIDFYNYFLSYNKRIEDMPYNLYVGVLGGLSYGDDKQSPVPSLKANDTGTSAILYGVQVGADHKLKSNLTFFTKYQYLKAKHSVNLNARRASAEVIRDNFNNLLFGVKWGF